MNTPSLLLLIIIHIVVFLYKFFIVLAFDVIIPTKFCRLEFLLSYPFTNGGYKDAKIFCTRQLGGMEKLKKEIEKCDIVCANCHLKYHYNHDNRQSRIIVETIADQFERAEQELVPTLEEEIAHAVYNDYFPEGVNPDCLTDEFYERLE